MTMISEESTEESVETKISEKSTGESIKIKISEEDKNKTDWFDKNKKKILAIVYSNKFNY